ncbi:site-specific integrase [Streptomyces sp. NPDC046909]|uniref:tyrosine-type recombinase/integrase n=1 Tax=Streptomyces sp. NPDC046909 TaxID=3155617 RepID=UPI0033EC53EC
MGATVQRLVNNLCDDLAGRTVRQIYDTTASVFTEAVFDRKIGSTPCVRVRLPEAETEEVKPLTVDEVEALSEATPDHLRAWPIVNAGSGLRTSEMLGLTWDRLDFDAATVKVDQQLVGSNRATGAPRFGTLKSKASYRTIPLPRTVVRALREHKMTALDAHGLVFAREDGRAYNRGSFSRVWVPTVALAGLPEGTEPKQLRHTYASLLIDGGESPKVIQKRMGHSSIKITMDVYGHLYPESEQRTRNVIDRAFDGGEPTIAYTGEVMDAVAA